MDDSEYFFFAGGTIGHDDQPANIRMRLLVRQVSPSRAGEAF